MKEFLLNQIPRLRSHNQKLDHLSRLYDHPWVIVNEVDHFMKVIFKPEGELLVSRDGSIFKGSWELLSSAKSIMLDLNGAPRLYNHFFLDKAVMVLKLDGRTNDLLVLANQNTIPSLDVVEHLKSLTQQERPDIYSAPRTEYPGPRDQSNSHQHVWVFVLIIVIIYLAGILASSF